MLLNAYEWNEVVYIYLLYIYIDCMYIHIFVCKFAKRCRCWPQAAGWRNRKHAERRKPNGCPDTPLLSSPLLRIARVPCPALPSSCRPRKSRNVSLWTPWRMDNANWIPMTRYHWCVLEICNSCFLAWAETITKPIKRRRRHVDRLKDAKTDRRADNQTGRRTATITRAIWQGQRQLRALNWPPFSKNNNTRINNKHTNNNCSHSINAANCCLSRSCRRRIAKRMKAKHKSELFTEVFCIVEHLNGK